MTPTTFRLAPLAVYFCGISLALIGCGGSGGGNPPPAQPPTITSVSVSPTAVTLTAGQTQQFSASVIGTGNFNSAVNWSLQGPGTVSSSGLYTAPTNVTTSVQATVVAASVQDTSKSGSATITVNPIAVAPVITTQPANQTVTVGQTATFTVVATGTSPLSYQWQKNGAAISGATSSSYVTPVTTIADNGSQFTVVVSNTAGSLTSSVATLTVNALPTPTIVSVSSAVFCPRECGPFSPTPIATITGTGFGVGDTITDQVGTSLTTFSITSVTTNGLGQVQTQVFVPNDTPRYNPGPHKYTITNTNGTSNPGFFNFLGNQDIVAVGKSTIGATQYYVLDQGAGVVHVYDASLNPLFDFPVGGLATGIAVDDTTGYISVAAGRVIGIFDATGHLRSGMTDAANDLFMAVAAKNGYLCGIPELANSLSCGHLTDPIPAATTIAIGATPMNIAMGMVNNQLTAAVLNIGEGTLAWTSVPAMPAPQFVSLPGFTKILQLYANPAIFAHGWQLKIFDSGPMAGTAAVLSRGDRSVWYVNLATRAVSGPFVIPGDPFRIAANNVDGSLRVVLADPLGLSGGAQLVKVSALGSVTAPQPAFSSVLPVGFTLSPDASQIIGFMRKLAESHPNN